MKSLITGHPFLMILAGVLFWTGANPSQAQSSQRPTPTFPAEFIRAHRAKEVPAEAGTSSPEKLIEAGEMLNRMAGWRRFVEFYYSSSRSQRNFSFRGAEQEFADDKVRVAWNLGPDAKGDLVTTGPKRTVHWRWLNTNDAGSTISLPDEAGVLLLRNGSECLSFSYKSRGLNSIDLLRWHQPEHVNIVSAGYLPSMAVVRESLNQTAFPFLLSRTASQTVNGQQYFMDGSGRVWVKDLTNDATYPVGKDEGDVRPIKDAAGLYVKIERKDPVSGTVELSFDQPDFDLSLFAATNPGNVQKTVFKKEPWSIADALSALAEGYKFNVDWNTAEAESYARSTPMSPTWQTRNSGAVLKVAEEMLGEDFATEAVSSSTLRVGLSEAYRARQELPQMVDRLHKEYKLETKLYLLKQLGMTQAQIIIERDLLGCYIIGKPTDTDVTSDTLKVKGKYWSVLKRPLAEKDALNKEFAGQKQMNNAIVCESIDNGNITVRKENGDVIIITATAETHGRIAHFLQSTDSEIREASVTSDDSNVPEQRRLQVVLLQGGKAGEQAAVAENGGTSVTYSAEVPAQFGMTPDDLKVLGFDGAVVTGRGAIDLVAKPGKTGEARVTLGGRYVFRIQYEQEQGGFLLVETSIEGEKTAKPLAQNTMMLEKGKPAFLGVTNLSGAVIVAVTWLDGEPQASH